MIGFYLKDFDAFMSTSNWVVFQKQNRTNQQRKRTTNTSNWKISLHGLVDGGSVCRAGSRVVLNHRGVATPPMLRSLHTQVVSLLFILLS